MALAPWPPPGYAPDVFVPRTIRDWNSLCRILRSTRQWNASNLIYVITLQCRLQLHGVSTPQCASHHVAWCRAKSGRRRRREAMKNNSVKLHFNFLFNTQSQSNNPMNRSHICDVGRHCGYDEAVGLSVKAVVTTTIRLRFDCNSTALRPVHIPHYDRATA